MTDQASGDNSRDHILQLETDIRKSMENGFPLLKFNHNLENHFLTYNLDARRKFFFVMTIIAFFMYNLFLFTDREMFPDMYRTAWQIRLGIVTPCMILMKKSQRRTAPKSAGTKSTFPPATVFRYLVRNPQSTISTAIQEKSGKTREKLPRIR